MSVPNWIEDIPNGSEFESLKVTLSSRYDGTVGPYAEIGYLTGGDTIAIGNATNGSHNSRVLDGDASYWGISGTARAIFNDLKSGAIKFNYKVDAASDGNSNHYIKILRTVMTYKLPDTKRASILITLP